MTIKLKNYTPLGIDYEREVKWIVIGFALSFTYSLGFFFSLSSHYKSLFRWTFDQKYELLSGAIMPDFIEILGHSLLGFIIVSLCMMPLLAYHYLYHYQESKSIYLMRRLPTRWEFIKRCSTLPILSTLLALFMAFLLLMLFFGIYMLVTPEACLEPNQWHKIWNINLGV